MTNSFIEFYQVFNVLGLILIVEVNKILGISKVTIVIDVLVLNHIQLIVMNVLFRCILFDSNFFYQEVFLSFKILRALNSFRIINRFVLSLFVLSRLFFQSMVCVALSSHFFFTKRHFLVII